MRDAMVSASAVFEPEEVIVLSAALRRAMKKIGDGGESSDAVQSEVARLIHNLGRSRVRLRKPMTSMVHAAEIADEAVELHAYLEEAPETVLASVRETGTLPKCEQRIVGAFPKAFRQPPVKRLWADSTLGALSGTGH